MIQNKLAIFGGKPVGKIPFIKPSPLSKLEINAANDVLKSGLLSRAGHGPIVKDFEKNFARYHDVKYAISTTSGTTALHTAICALGIGQGDEVLVPALTFVSTASVILQEKATPVFVDIKPSDFCMNSIEIERKITKKTKAIIVVHLYGHPADMDAILKIAKKYNIIVIEDCAQAHGAKYKQKLVGTLGDIGCFSFYQTKNMTCGEGGMIITNNKNIFRDCVALVNHGQLKDVVKTYDYDRIGFNYHMTELQATIGNVQLTRLETMNQERRINASLYRSLLKDTELQLQEDVGEIEHVYYSLTALLPPSFTKKRNWFLDAMNKENCELNRIYPIPLNKTSLFKPLGQSCPKAEDVCARLFNFYVNPGIKRKTIINTCKAVKKILLYLKKEHETR